jgi:tetratricopeptide (TPR) repeat protein
MAEQDDETHGLDAALVLRLSAQWLLVDPDRERYLRRMAESGPLLFAEAITDDPAEVQRHPMRKVLRADAPRFFRSLGWMIASAMPLPAHDWQPQRAPLPGRNEPCLCGSGAKFKHCCARLIEGAPQLDPLYLASLVILALPAKAWSELPASRVPPDAVAGAAQELQEGGRARDAMRLLEPWAKVPAPWPAARVELLDLLADLYLEQGHPRKRKALAEAMVARGDVAVQSLGWQRLSMMASDAGDAAAARQAFERAQRLTPDDPRVALLEVTTLLGSGEVDRAHERAAFHARRLERLPQAAELAPQIEGLRRLASGELDHLVPGAADDEADDDDDGLLDEIGFFGELADWLRRQPPPRLRLDLAAARPDDLGELQPDKRLRPALQAWLQAFDADASPQGQQGIDPARWWAVLQRHPALLDNFDVLDAMLGALDGVPFGLAAEAQKALLNRALDLWTLLRQRYPQARCEWAWVGNRPALRLLVRRVELDTSPRAEHCFDWLRALVEVLNPNDNHGLRDRLAAVLLRRGEFAAALALAERYPDDFVGLQLLHARTLLALQRLPDAEAVLAAALKDNPHVLPLLKARRAPRLPEVDSYRVGSPEQARIVVAEQHDLWRDKALQKWLAERESPSGGPVQLTLT